MIDRGGDSKEAHQAVAEHPKSCKNEAVWRMVMGRQKCSNMQKIRPHQLACHPLFIELVVAKQLLHRHLHKRHAINDVYTKSLYMYALVWKH